MTTLRYALFAALLLAAAPAAASDVYPDGIGTHLGFADPPPCTICHTTLSGGFGTISQPFGQQMQARGLVAFSGSFAPLQNALDALDAESSDVDGDGIEDVQELRDGTDPNSAGAGAGPEYGCIGNVAPVRSGWAGGALVFIALAFVVARRRSP